MSVGYLVTLGDGSLGANDSVSGAQSSFTIDSLLGTGSWSWTGTSGGTPYSGFTDTGTYFLGDDGNVYFTPDSVFPDSGSGAVGSAPAYSTGAYHGTEGADSHVGGAGDDFIIGDGGGDTLRGATGADTIIGGDGKDIIYGNEDGDSMEGGAGADSIYGEYGDDYVSGGAGDDHLEGNEGADTIVGGDGDDWMRGSYDNDELWGGKGDDYLWGGYNDDTFHMENDFGNDTIDAEGIAEVAGDTLDLSLVTDDLSVDLTGGNPEDGSFSDGVSTATFNEIENIVLGGGRDTIVLADGSGADRVLAFDMADSGDGTTNDRLDVSALTSDGGTTQVTTNDVSVSDDGAGNAVLSFPGGESITLMGVAPGALGDAAALESIGIPAGAGGGTGGGTGTPDYIVEGTSGADVIDAGYLGDPEGDKVDNGDNAAGNDDDVIEAYGGDDSVVAGLGDDSVDGGAGNDTLRGAAGEDTIIGGDGDDSIYGNEGGDSMEGGAGADSIYGEFGDDYVSGGAGDDHLEGNEGADTIVGGDGDDWMRGSYDNDELWGGEGDDYLWGGYNDDTFHMENNFGNDTIAAEGIAEVAGDTLDLSLVTDDLSVDLTDGNPERGSFSDGVSTATFNEIENIVLGSGRDTIVLADGSGADRVLAFDMADSGDGTTNDRLDVSALTSDGGTTQVTTNDVSVSDDGAGNAVLSFPGGESITLMGVAPGALGDAAALESIGIPAVGGPVSDHIVEGSGGADTIDAAYTGDPDGDKIDANDAVDGSNSDLVYGYGGDDVIDAGAADDTVHGGAGADTISGGTGDDRLLGEAGDDQLSGGAGADTLAGGAGDDSLDLGTADGVADTVVLADGDGADTVAGFGAPTDNGDGTFTGQDQVDVSGLSDAGGAGVNVDDVTVSDTNGDGTGDAILSFPGGEKITLTGVSVSAVSSDAQLQAMGIPGAARDYIVEGTGGDDTINDGYTGDPEGDRIDAHDAADGSDDDSVRAGAGDDVIDAGSGNDTIDGGAGDDEIFLDAALQNDSIIGGEADEDGGGDRINLSSIANDVTVNFTGAEAGTISDGSAVTTFSEIEQIQMGTGDDSVSGSAGAENILGNSGGDTVEGNGGDDTIDGGDDADLISGGAGNDSLMGGAGADTLSGGAGDDQIDLGLADGDADLLQMGDGGGSDVVSAFEAPTDNGDGTFSGQDMLDVSDLHDAGGDPVSVEDVAVSDTVGDGTGNAILSFPGGETITLLGVTVGQVSSPEQLEAMGIPAAGVVSDYIVEGTSGADSIDAAYTGDPEGDMIDAGDAADGSDDDSVEAGAGNDTIEAGLGDDTVRAGAGDDLVHGGAGNDEIYGFEGSDTVFGGDGDDTINTRTSLGAGVPDEGYADSHGSGLSYPADTDPDNDRDSVEGGAGNDSILTGDDDDTISGGSGDDTVDAGFDDDSVQGDTGEDWLEGNEGSDTLEGGADADTLYGDVAPSNANYAGYVPYELANDGSDDAPDNNADSLSGGAGDDSLYGQDDDDTLRGGDGADLLDGGIDNDALYGGEGADTLIGGAGDDYLELAEGDSAEGGAGDDTFRITDLGEAGSDGITVVGGEGDETAGDTLEFGGLTDWSDVTYTNSDPGAGGGLSGSAVLHDGSVVTFSEIENVVICFTAGTRIATAEGPRPVEDLRRGDLVVTRDHGLQKVRWAGQRRVAALGSLAPVRFDAGALGNARPLLVSPQHRMLITGPEAALLFGDAEVLASAKHLVNGGTIRQVPGGEVTYVHILFDRHEIVYAEGAASESFFPGDAGIGAVDEAAREELFTVFPELRNSTGGFEKTARICLRRHESRLFGIG